MTTTPVDPGILDVIDAAGQQQWDLEQRVTSYVAGTWEAFDSWYDPAAVDEVSGHLADVVGQGQTGEAQLTDAYLAAVLSIMAGVTVSAVGVPGSFDQTRRLGGVTAKTVYERTAVTFRWLVSQDRPALEAKRQAIERAKVTVSTDLALARRDMVARVLEERRIEGYRRVVRPEFARHGSCGLCAVASDRIYHRENLLPLHGRCHCTVLPIYHDYDPGASINLTTLGAAYAVADSTSGRSLKRVRMTVVHHGELGPQLRVSDQNFRGPSFFRS